MKAPFEVIKIPERGGKRKHPVDRCAGSRYVLENAAKRGWTIVPDILSIEPVQWTAAALIILGCSLLQSVAGFGFSLLSVPLLLFAGFSFPHSVTISLMTSAAQRLFAVRHLRSHVPWRLIAPLIAAALLMVPVGIVTQRLLNRTVSMDRIRQMVGVMILLTLALRILWRVRPREQVAFPWGLLAGGLAGFLTGLANIGGPPVVLWSHAHRWNAQRLRVVVLAITLPLVPAQAVLQGLAYGPSMVPAFVMSLFLAPVSVLGAALGLYVGRFVSLKWLKALVYGLLLGIAAVAILKPLLP